MPGSISHILATLTTLSAIVRNLAIIGGCTVGGYTFIRGLGILRSRIEIQRENVSLRKFANEAEAAAKSYKRLYNLLKGEMESVRREMKRLQDRFEHTNKMLASAVLYIVDLHEHKAGKTPMPPLPKELKSEIEAALDERGDSDEAPLAGTIVAPALADS